MSNCDQIREKDAGSCACGSCLYLMTLGRPLGAPEHLLLSNHPVFIHFDFSHLTHVVAPIMFCHLNFLPFTAACAPLLPEAVLDLPIYFFTHSCVFAALLRNFAFSALVETSITTYSPTKSALQYHPTVITEDSSLTVVADLETSDRPLCPFDLLFK